MSKKTARIIKLSIVTVILVCFASELCQRIWEPSVNPSERWVSQNPNIWFVVFDEEKGTPYGQIIVSGLTIEISPAVIYGNRLEVTDYPTIEPGVVKEADILMKGECTFHKDWFVVKIAYDRDGLFEGIDMITFRKEYINTD